MLKNRRAASKIFSHPISHIIVILSVILLFSGCPPEFEVPLLTFEGAEQSRDDVFWGFAGTFSLDTDPEGSTLIGNRSTTNLVMENIGTEDIIITDIGLFRHLFTNDVITGFEEFQTIFGFADGLKPDLPIVIPPGSTYDGIFLYFEPVIAGYESGTLVLDTNSGQITLRVAGYGAWEITFTVPLVVPPRGKIIEPIEVLAGDSIVYRATDTEIALKAAGIHPLGFYDLQNWTTTTPGTVSFVDDTAEETTAILTGTGSIEAVFINLYLLVGPSGTYATIEAAISAFNPAVNKGIVVETGTYNPAVDLDMVAGSLKGGYNAGFTARDITTNVTTINLGAYTLIFNETTGTAGFLEGFTIYGGDNASDSTTSLRIYGSAPTITNNIITGGADTLRSTAIHVINEPENDLLSLTIKPVIQNNTITGGTTTDAGGTSYGIYIDWYSDPQISDNIIAGGNSSGSGGRSFGIYSVNQCSPLLENNSISGGTGDSLAAPIYLGYGGYPEIEDNTLFNGSAGTTLGIIFWTFARIETLTGNNFYNCDTAFVYNYFDDTYLTTIDEVNEEFLPDETDPDVLNRNDPP